MKQFFKLKQIILNHNSVKYNIIALDITKAFDTVSIHAIIRNLSNEILSMKNWLKEPNKLLMKILSLIKPWIEKRDLLVPQGAPSSSLLYVISAQQFYAKLSRNSFKWFAYIDDLILFKECKGQSVEW